MDARIAVGNEIISLSQLKQTGKIQKRGASWVLPLDERSRGKITLARHDDPVPVRHAAAAPAAAAAAGVGARSALTGVDWFFTTIAAISFLLHLVLVIYLRNVDWPRKPDIEAIPDRFVQMVVKKEEKKPEPKKVEEVAKTEDEKKAGEAEGRRGEEAPKTRADRRGEGEAGRGEGQGRTPSGARASPSR